MFQRPDGAGHIGEQRRIDRAMAEILPQRIGDFVLVRDQQIDGAVQPFDSLFGTGRAVLDMRLFLTRQNLLHARLDVCFHWLRGGAHTLSFLMCSGGHRRPVTIRHE